MFLNYQLKLNTFMFKKKQSVQRNILIRDSVKLKLILLRIGYNLWAWLRL